MPEANGSYRRAPEPSEAEWGRHGYGNWWGGFHRTTDTFGYLGLLRLLVTHPRSSRFVLHLLWWRWKHRACDTVDFHHYACTRDDFGRRLDADWRWREAWKPDARDRSEVER